MSHPISEFALVEFLEVSEYRAFELSRVRLIA